MPLATCKLILQTNSIHVANRLWENSMTSRIAKQTWPSISKSRSIKLCKLSRTDCSAVIRAITGHWIIGTHARRLNALLQ